MFFFVPILNHQHVVCIQLIFQLLFPEHTRNVIFPVANLTNQLLYKNMFHVVQHDEHDDDVGEVLFYVLEAKQPNQVIQNTYETIYESTNKIKTNN